MKGSPSLTEAGDGGMPSTIAPKVYPSLQANSVSTKEAPEEMHFQLFCKGMPAFENVMEENVI